MVCELHHRSKSQLNETTIEQTLRHEKHEKLFICGMKRTSKREKEINCEQTEILTALIMAKNRDSAERSVCHFFASSTQFEALAGERTARSEFKAVIDFCSISPHSPVPE